LTLDVLRTVEERDSIPVVLLDSYADAVDRHGLGDSRVNDELPTPGEAIGQARAQYQEVLEAMSAFPLEGGGDRWYVFQQRLADYVAAAALAVVTAQHALRKAGVSEFTDPAFAGLVEGDDR
jgi:hypothetical protein